MAERLADRITPQHRELAARCALLASMRFQRMGWEYGWGGNEHVPDAEDLARTIGELLAHMFTAERCGHGHRGVSSGRLMTDESKDGMIDVYLHLATRSAREAEGDEMSLAGVRVVQLSKELCALPSKVRAVRVQRGLSHRQAAEEIGMAYADLCRFEQGKKDVRLSTALKLTDWMERNQ